MCYNEIGDIMQKRISAKQALGVLLTVILIISGYLVYTVMNDKISNTFYYVVFDSDGGSRVNSTTVKLNDKIEKPEDPTKDGYKFKYWALNNVEYDFNTKVRRNVKLVAIWEVDSKKGNEGTDKANSNEENNVEKSD